MPDALEGAAARDHHDKTDPHHRGRWLSDLVLGAQDGLVNTLGVVLGVAAATSSARIVVATGFAAAAAESISMAAVAYTSSVARGDLFRAERDRERRHVARVPRLEREEIRALYARKGFDGELLDRVVDTICANREVWVDVMMREEHGLAPVDRRASLRSAVIVGSASFLGASMPVLPFLVFERTAAIVAAIGTGALLLFLLGAYTARVTVGHSVRGGLTLAVIGSTSALLGWVVGELVSRAI